MTSTERGQYLGLEQAEAGPRDVGGQSAHERVEHEDAARREGAKHRDALRGREHVVHPGLAEQRGVFERSETGRGPRLRRNPSVLVQLAQRVGAVMAHAASGSRRHAGTRARARATGPYLFPCARSPPRDTAATARAVTGRTRRRRAPPGARVRPTSRRARFVDEVVAPASVARCGGPRNVKGSPVHACCSTLTVSSTTWARSRIERSNIVNSDGT